MGRQPGLWIIDGMRLRELRQAAGWSQLELSCRTGISQSAICTMENGTLTHVHSKTLSRLAAALAVPPARLMAAAIER